MFSYFVFVLLLVQLLLSSDILESPQSVKVLSGSPATMKCRTSQPSSAIIWYKDGSEFLLDQKVGSCLLLPDGSLFFLTTQAGDTGDYFCEVTGRNIGGRSREARLNVFDSEEDLISDIDDHHPTLDVFLPTKLEPPANISAQLLLDGTAIVKWRQSAKATGYLVTVLANTIPVTNISVDRSVTTVQLHNLSPSHEYSFCVASVAGHLLSPFSEEQKLYLKSPLTIQTRPYHNVIPTEIWVIAVLVAIMMTLIIILVITIIVIRTRRVARMTHQGRMEYVEAGNKNICHYQEHTQQCHSVYHPSNHINDNIYTYATSDPYDYSSGSDRSSSNASASGFTSLHKEPLIPLNSYS